MRLVVTSDVADELHVHGYDLEKALPAGVQTTVEFVARYKVNGKAERLHEVSRFVKMQHYWYYLNGTFQESD